MKNILILFISFILLTEGISQYSIVGKINGNTLTFVLRKPASVPSNTGLSGVQFRLITPSGITAMPALTPYSLVTAVELSTAAGTEYPLTSTTLSSSPTNTSGFSLSGAYFEVAGNEFTNYSFEMDVVAPITLKSFTASKLEGNNALLNWSTSSEVDASHFELERSFDLQSWKSIDKQVARGQQGIETSYSFVDQNIIAQRSNDGVCYYRLGMVDLDGSKKKSDIRSINLDPLTETYYQTFPNPAKGVINVQLQVPNTQANMTDLILMDNAGRVHTKTAVSTNGITKIDVSDLPKGVYHLQVNTGTEMLSKKVILVED
jgi:hypothetical protein